MAGRRYKRGMADASRAYQAFGQKQEDALRHILNEVQGVKKDISKALGELDTNFDNLYDRLDASEKEKLYSVSMPFDLKTLDEYEKMFLIGALFALADDCRPTENQKKYILSLKKYLEISEPPKEPVDPLNIENIDSIDAQKAIYQVALEYLSLQDEDCFDITELQTDFLDSFNLSPRIRESITARVNFFYDILGSAGLIEKYVVIIGDQNAFYTELQKRMQNSEQELNKIMGTLEKDFIAIPFSELYHPDSDILYNDYISKEACMMAIGGELQKEYDSATNLLNSRSTNSIAQTAYLSVKDNIPPILESIRHNINILIEIVNAEDLKGVCLDFLDLNKYEADLLDALKNELANSLYSLPPISKYGSQIEFESDDLELETGFFRRFLEKMAAKWSASGYPFGEIREDLDKLVNTYEKASNRIFKEILVNQIKNRVEEVVTKIMAFYQ